MTYTAAKAASADSAASHRYVARGVAAFAFDGLSLMILLSPRPVRRRSTIL
jgi:hypothetical protein